MKPKNIKQVIFIIASLIIFIVLSVNSFVWASGNYSGEFIFIYCLALFLFLISLVGMVFPKKIYNFFMKIGNKILSASVYYNDMSVDKEQGNKSFNITCKVIAVISNILLVVLLILELVSIRRAESPGPGG